MQHEINDVLGGAKRPPYKLTDLAKAVVYAVAEVCDPNAPFELIKRKARVLLISFLVYMYGHRLTIATVRYIKSWNDELRYYWGLETGIIDNPPMPIRTLKVSSRSKDGYPLLQDDIGRTLYEIPEQFKGTYMENKAKEFKMRKDNALPHEIVLTDEGDCSQPLAFTGGKPCPGLILFVTGNYHVIGKGWRNGNNTFVTPLHVAAEFPPEVGVCCGDRYVKVRREDIKVVEAWAKPIDMVVMSLRDAVFATLGVAKLEADNSDTYANVTLRTVEGANGKALESRASLVTKTPNPLLYMANYSSRPGDSGCPIFERKNNKDYVVGMHLGYAEDSESNVFVATRFLLNWYREAMEEATTSIVDTPSSFPTVMVEANPAEIVTKDEKGDRKGGVNAASSSERGGHNFGTEARLLREAVVENDDGIYVIDKKMNSYTQKDYDKFVGPSETDILYKSLKAKGKAVWADMDDDYANESNPFGDLVDQLNSLKNFDMSNSLVHSSYQYSSILVSIKNESDPPKAVSTSSSSAAESKGFATNQRVDLVVQSQKRINDVNKQIVKRVVAENQSNTEQFQNICTFVNESTRRNQDNIRAMGVDICKMYELQTHMMNGMEVMRDEIKRLKQTSESLIIATESNKNYIPVDQNKLSEADKNFIQEILGAKPKPQAEVEAYKEPEGGYVPPPMKEIVMKTSQPQVASKVLPAQPAVRLESNPFDDALVTDALLHLNAPVTKEGEDFRQQRPAQAQRENESLVTSPSIVQPQTEESPKISMTSSQVAQVIAAMQRDLPQEIRENLMKMSKKSFMQLMTEFRTTTSQQQVTQTNLNQCSSIPSEEPKAKKQE